MQLVDYSQVVIAAFFANKVMIDTPDQDLMRHIILNTLRSYNLKYRTKYGQMVICADGNNTWRKQVFPYYKGNRAKNRDESGIDWSLIFETLNMVYAELVDHSPFLCVRQDGAEADDVIAVLAKHSFKNSEPSLIISSDKDFKQLQRYDGISQYSPALNNYKGGFIVEESPNDFLVEHTIKGDPGDGIPNIFSDDDVFMNQDKRQAPATSNRVKQMTDYLWSSSSKTIPQQWRDNYTRNKELIDLDQIPSEITHKIMGQFLVAKSQTNKADFLEYLIAKKCKLLIKDINDFYNM